MEKLQPSRFQRLLAKASWLVPAGLLILAVNQANVASDVFETLRDGEAAVATVTEYERIDRADVTYGYVSLLVELQDGSVLTREKMSLPHSLMQQLEGQETLDVRILSDADQNIVIATVASTQWKIAAIQSGISLLAGILALVGVMAWNKSLTKRSISHSTSQSDKAELVFESAVTEDRL